LAKTRTKPRNQILLEQHGNLAYQRIRPERRGPSPSPLPPTKKRTSSNREAAVLFTLILCLVAISVAFISNYSSVVAVQYEIQQVEREISQLKEKNAQLQAEAKKLGSLKRIEAIALNEIGLQYPEEKEWLLLSAVND